MNSYIYADKYIDIYTTYISIYFKAPQKLIYKTLYIKLKLKVLRYLPF